MDPEIEESIERCAQMVTEELSGEPQTTYVQVLNGLIDRLISERDSSIAGMDAV
jgi:hypothetical protein